MDDDHRPHLRLGLFIAKTLLERSGATLAFRNASGRGEGAMVIIEWPRERFLSEAGEFALEPAR